MIRVRLQRPWSCATVLASLALIAVACDQPTGSTRPRSRAASAEVAGVDAAAPEAPAPAPAPEPYKPRPILGQRTSDIKDAQVETKPQAGGIEKAPKITAKDPITLVGNAYVSIVGQASVLNIQHALDLYQATNGDYPKTYDEFKEKIIRENNIALPMLPFYQEYGYDAPTHRLLILEYPDRKAQANYPQ